MNFSNKLIHSISKNFVQICVIIFDECHWASPKRRNKFTFEETGHSYRRIMDFIKEKQCHNKIRIVGTTASVLNAFFHPTQLNSCCEMLEETMNARIMGEFDFDPIYLAEPDVELWRYKSPFDLVSEYTKLFKLHERIEAKIKKHTTEDDERYFRNMLNISDYVERPILKPDYFRRMIRDLMDVHCELGIYPAFLLCRELIEELNRKLLLPSDDNNRAMIEVTMRFLIFLDTLYVKTIRKVSKEKPSHQVILELSTPKLLKLMDIIAYQLDKKKDFSILVFVDRVMFSFAIFKYIDQLTKETEHSEIKPNFFVGNNNDYVTFKFIKESVKNFENTIRAFKNGQYNLLISTAVLEEGIDIGTCNLVVRFSEPATYREYVQSKGRARAKDSLCVIMQDEDYYMKGAMENYQQTEKFLKLRFKKDRQLEQSILPDEVKIIEKEERFQSKTGSLILINQAGQFITRYIKKKGNNKYIAEYSWDQVELEVEATSDDENNNEPTLQTHYIFKLNLRGVTPLVDEIVGKPYLDIIDAAKSACLAACRKLYEMGQLDEHFIPISDETVIKRCNLINKEYTDEEVREMNFIFDVKNKQRLMFEKEISNFDFYKQFIKSKDAFNFYEIVFLTNDLNLNTGDDRLLLITELDLISACRINTLQNSLHDTTIQLNKVKKGFSLTKDQLHQIGKFTLEVFKTAIPMFRKRSDDLNFDLDECLFKFAFLDSEQAIDYEKMKKFIDQSDDEQLDKESLLQKGEELLAHSIFTNTDHLLVSVNTHIYAHDTIDYNGGRAINFIEFYKQHHDLIIDPSDQFYQVEITNSRYLIQANQKSTQVKTRQSYKYFPKQLLSISLASDGLRRKLSCLPPFIHRIKQKLILKIFYTSLNKKVLDIEMNPDFEDIFSTARTTYQTNIDQYIDELAKKLAEKKIKPQLCASASNSDLDSSSNYDSDDDCEETSVDDEKDLLEEESFIVEKAKEIAAKKVENRKKKKVEIFNGENVIFHPLPDELKLNKYLNDSLTETLQFAQYVDLDEFLNEVIEKFECIIKRMNLQDTEQRKYNETESNREDDLMLEDDELKDINFDIWTNEKSDKELISMEMLLAALTTSWAGDSVEMEALEFMGDCFLKLITCSLLFHLYPNVSVGEMDLLKNRAVCNKSLYGISRRNQLHNYIFADQFLPGELFSLTSYSFHLQKCKNKLTDNNFYFLKKRCELDASWIQIFIGNAELCDSRCDSGGPEWLSNREVKPSKSR